MKKGGISMMANVEEERVSNPNFQSNDEEAKLRLLEEISKPQYYNNRELSWLALNERV